MQDKHKTFRDMSPTPPTCLLLCSLLFALLCAPQISFGTTLVRLTEAQMLERSTLVVRGHVEQKRSMWTKNKLAIVTLIRIKVAQELVGRKAPSHVTLRCYGGQVGDQKMAAADGPRFALSEEVLVFLQPNKYIAGEYLLTGWSQGKWSITRPGASFSSTQEENKQAQLWRAPTHARVLKQQNGTRHAQVSAPFEQQKTLHAMIQRLRYHWNKQRARRAKQALQVNRAAAPTAPSQQPAKGSK